MAFIKGDLALEIEPNGQMSNRRGQKRPFQRVAAPSTTVQPTDRRSGEFLREATEREMGETSQLQLQILLQSGIDSRRGGCDWLGGWLAVPTVIRVILCV